MIVIRRMLVAILTWEARLVLLRHRPKIIAITGNVGKTSAKDAIYAVLEDSVHVRKSEKSMNTDIGVPLTILGVRNPWSNPWRWVVTIVRGFAAVFPRRYPEWLVLEVGADHPGDIRAIARSLKPDIVVVTGIPDVPVHVEFFDSPEALAREKKELVKYVRPGGAVILNGDDARVAAFGKDRVAVYYGLAEGSDVRASSVAVEYEGKKPVGMLFHAASEGESSSVSVRGALGLPRVYAALAALAVVREFEIPLTDAARSLGKWLPPRGRMRILEGANGAIILDDTYNSSPAPALSALDTLKEIKGVTKRIAVLADMMELGRFTAEAHREVGRKVAECADLLVTVGVRARGIAEAARAAGMPAEAIREYEQDQSQKVGQDLQSELGEGVVVLVKGSQSMRMERAVKVLLSHPEQAPDLLVRQEEEWVRR